MFTLLGHDYLLKGPNHPHFQLSIIFPDPKSKQLLHWTYEPACARAHYINSKCILTKHCNTIHFPIIYSVAIDKLLSRNYYLIKHSSKCYLVFLPSDVLLQVVEYHSFKLSKPGLLFRNSWLVTLFNSEFVGTLLVVILF